MLLIDFSLHILKTIPKNIIPNTLCSFYNSEKQILQILAPLSCINAMINLWLIDHFLHNLNQLHKCLNTYEPSCI